MFNHDNKQGSYLTLTSLLCWALSVQRPFGLALKWPAWNVMPCDLSWCCFFHKGMFLLIRLLRYNAAPLTHSSVMQSCLPAAEWHAAIISAREGREDRELRSRSWASQAQVQTNHNPFTGFGRAQFQTLTLISKLSWKILAELVGVDTHPVRKCCLWTVTQSRKGPNGV